MNKVAILIPTKERKEFLLRTVRYYISVKSKHPIFIGDASSNSLEEYILDLAKNKIEIYYFHWKELNDREAIVELAIEANKRKISYCAYHGDDDYFFPNSLVKCANFLEENSSYATAQGRSFSFQLDQSGPYGKIKDIGIYWNQKELKGESSTERIIEISNNYWVPIFSVNRISNYIEDIGNGIDEVIDRNFGEYINSTSIALRGKSKFIDCLYLARNLHSGINHGTKFEWVTGENWHVSYIESIKALSQKLADYDNIELEQSKEIITQAMRKMISLECKKKPELAVFIRNMLIFWSNNSKFGHSLRIFFKKISKISIFSCSKFTKGCLINKKSKYFEYYLSVQNSCKKK